MLRNLRIILATISFILISLLFLDITGITHKWLGWMAEIQLVPAILALNLGVIVVLVLLTFLFGRVYCSVICPLGIMQDLIAWIPGKIKKKNKFRYKYTKEKKTLKNGVLGIFILFILLGATDYMSLIEPYSMFGRIVSSIFSPIYALGNNALAWIAERFDSYAFYSTEVWLKSLTTLIIAFVTLVVLFVLAWKGGRTYCNTICPVGTLLGWISRYSIFVPTINTEACTACKLCGRKCRSSCIDMENHVIDYSRCVMCMDCIDTCKEGAIKLGLRKGFKNFLNRTKTESANTNKTKGAKNITETKNIQESRRAFITSSAIVATAATIKAQEMKVDGGLAIIEKKKVPHRNVAIKPAGSQSLKRFAQHCTACQLCVAKCPNNVLRPSTSFLSFMQPEMSYERGYCRPECTICSEVCPTNAIKPITKEEKSSIQIGRAIVLLENCVVNTDGVPCGNCAKHCPVGAIKMVKKDPDAENSLRIPTVNEEKCIGCGACEFLCPARPFSAIRIRGYENHRTI